MYPWNNELLPSSWEACHTKLRPMVCVYVLCTAPVSLPHKTGHFAAGQPAVFPYQQMVAGLPRGRTAPVASQPPPYKAPHQPIIDTWASKRNVGGPSLHFGYFFNRLITLWLPLMTLDTISNDKSLLLTNKLKELLTEDFLSCFRLRDAVWAIKFAGWRKRSTSQLKKCLCRKNSHGPRRRPTDSPVIVEGILNMLQVKQWQEAPALTAAMFGWRLQWLFKPAKTRGLPRKITISVTR